MTESVAEREDGVYGAHWLLLRRPISCLMVASSNILPEATCKAAKLGAIFRWPGLQHVTRDKTRLARRGLMVQTGPLCHSSQFEEKRISMLDIALAVEFVVEKDMLRLLRSSMPP